MAKESVSKTGADSPKTAVSTRDHLVAVGLDLMRRGGYGATGLQELLKAAGVPKGSFYHHFGSKESFAAAVLEHYVAEQAKYCEEMLGDTRQAPLRRLRRYFEGLIGRAGQTAQIQGCLLGKMSLEVAGASKMLQNALSADFATWQAVIAGVLREAVELGDLAASTKPGPLAAFVLNSWQGALMRSQADRSDVPLTNFVRFVFDELLVA